MKFYRLNCFAQPQTVFLQRFGGRFAFLLLFLFSIQLSYAQKAVLEIPLMSGWKMREMPAGKWQQAVVPGCVHSDLLRNKQIPEPYYRTNERELQWIDKRDWEYRSTLNVSSDVIKKEHLELVFKGLDTFADVYVNDQKVISTDNMFREWVVDVKPFLKKGNNNLRIVFKSPIEKGLVLLKENGFMLRADNDQAVNGGLAKDQLVSPFIRKAPYHFGWDWGPRFVTSGIWRPVSLRAWSGVMIDDFFVQQQELSPKMAKLNAQLQIESDKSQNAVVEIKNDNRVIAKKSVSLKPGNNQIEVPFSVNNPKLWWTNGLGEAHLYKFTASINAGGGIDNKTRETGLRTLRLIQKPDEKGHTYYFELNGIPVFAKGANHIPNDMFLDKVTKEVYENEIETAVKSNFNMLRIWGGGIYEDEYFYELCDRNGILIWQDFMFACSLYPGNKEFLNSVAAEADYQVKRLRNHACIALWCGNNEIDIAIQRYNKKGGWGWKQSMTEQQNDETWASYDTIFNHILAKSVQDYAPQTPYVHSSPLTVVAKSHANDTNPSGDVHYWGVWWGKHPFEKYADNIGRFMSEYGFQSFPEIQTVKKYALPEDYDIESEVMRSHQRSSIGNVTIKEYMDMYYRKPVNFEKFLYVGQVLQAYGINFAVESHRRAMPYNMGSLVWQINDCWPVASWSSTDYYRRWKALQYELKRSFEPVIISPYAQGDSTKVAIVSDRLDAFSSELKMSVCDFSGKTLWSRNIPVNVKANGVVTAFGESNGKLTTKPNDTYLLLTIKDKTGKQLEKIFFFSQPKNLNLAKPQVQARVEKVKSDWMITLRTNVLAKNLNLDFPDVEGVFSDNYFDLIPGKEYKLIFTPKNKNLSPVKLVTTSLVDSY